MLELVVTRASVIGCFAEASALDRLAGAFRIAPDEAMVVASSGAGPAATVELAAKVAQDDPRSLVLDTTDGWAISTLRGDQVRVAFSYLSELELPEAGFIQGTVADIPMKIVVADEQVHLFAPAMWHSYVRERILSACSPMGISEHEEPVDWAEAP